MLQPHPYSWHPIGPVQLGSAHANHMITPVSVPWSWRYRVYQKMHADDKWRWLADSWVYLIVQAFHSHQMDAVQLWEIFEIFNVDSHCYKHQVCGTVIMAHIWQQPDTAESYHWLVRVRFQAKFYKNPVLIWTCNKEHFYIRPHTSLWPLPRANGLYLPWYLTR